MKWLKQILGINNNNRSNYKVGQVKFFNRQRGYGFIVSDQTSKDVFVHISRLEQKVRKGDKVRFELIHTHRGLEASKVKLMAD